MPRAPRLSPLAKLGLLVALNLALVFAFAAKGPSPEEHWRRTVAAAQARRWQEFLDFFPDSSFSGGIDRNSANVILSTYFDESAGWYVQDERAPGLPPLWGQRRLNYLALVDNRRRTIFAKRYERSWAYPLTNRYLVLGTEQKVNLWHALQVLAVKRFPHPEAGLKNEPSLAIYEFLLAEEPVFRAKGATSLYEQKLPGGATLDLIDAREDLLRRSGVNLEHIAKKYYRNTSP